MIVYPEEGGSPVTLCDDAAGDYGSLDLPSQTRIGTAVPLYGANYQKLFNGGNRLNSFAMQVDRQHADLATAAAFKFTHADDVPVSGVVEIKQNNVTRWLAEALIIEVRCVKHDGKSTVFAYTILGGQFSTANPNT